MKSKWTYDDLEECVLDENGGRIAVIDGDEVGNVKAIGTLVAAAPEMLSMLKQVLSLGVFACGPEIHALIAKAEGRAR